MNAHAGIAAKTGPPLSEWLENIPRPSTVNSPVSCIASKVASTPKRQNSCKLPEPEDTVCDPMISESMNLSESETESHEGSFSEGYKVTQNNNATIQSINTPVDQELEHAVDNEGVLDVMKKILIGIDQLKSTQKYLLRAIQKGTTIESSDWEIFERIVPHPARNASEMSNINSCLEDLSTRRAVVCYLVSLCGGNLRAGIREMFLRIAEKAVLAEYSMTGQKGTKISLKDSYPTIRKVMLEVCKQAYPKNKESFIRKEMGEVLKSFPFTLDRKRQKLRETPSIATSTECDSDANGLVQQRSA